jgi:hypothetical protein
MDELWQKTQQPDLHQRWDLRFTSITYLPREDNAPQRFFYETRIGFGLAIAGEGESIGTRTSDRERTSSLRFWSDDLKSLISEGSGYWKYIQTSNAVRFFTWYDYQTRMGAFGRLANIVFKPLMGWATAWSFDRLRLWIEDSIPPEVVLRSTIVYGIARASLIFIWLWHGAVPKLISPQSDELRLLSASGLAPHWLPWFGATEVAWALAGLCAWRWRGFFALSAIAMIAATLSVLTTLPQFFLHAFNPLTLNLSVTALCVIGWIVAPFSAFAGRCLRRPLRGIS